jgi:hypothetical protein
MCNLATHSLINALLKLGPDLAAGTYSSRYGLLNSGGLMQYHITVLVSNSVLLLLHALGDG